MSFDNVPGNAPIKEILRSALRRKSLLPSLLFCGVEGAGQQETALELAKAFNCLNLEDDACDECSSCRAIEAGNHPDVIKAIDLPRKPSKKKAGQTGGDDVEENGPEDDGEDEEKEEDKKESEKKAKNIVIHQIRRAMEIAMMKPMVGRKRVFFVDDAAEMEEAAENASLKILEEPPSFSQFILITAHPDRLLPTILSRCQTLMFGAVGADDIAAVLSDRGEEDARAAVIAAIVRGNYHRALTEDWDAYFEARGEAWDWFRAILSGDNGTEFIRKFSGGRKPPARDDMAPVLDFFRDFGRDLLLLGETGGGEGLFHPDLEPGLRELAAAVDPGRVLRLIRALDTASAALEENANVRLLTSVLYARMTG